MEVERKRKRDEKERPGNENPSKKRKQSYDQKEVVQCDDEFQSEKKEIEIVPENEVEKIVGKIDKVEISEEEIRRNEEILEKLENYEEIRSGNNKIEIVPEDEVEKIVGKIEKVEFTAADCM